MASDLPILWSKYFKMWSVKDKHFMSQLQLVWDGTLQGIYKYAPVTCSKWDQMSMFYSWCRILASTSEAFPTPKRLLKLRRPSVERMMPMMPHVLLDDRMHMVNRCAIPSLMLFKHIQYMHLRSHVGTKFRNLTRWVQGLGLSKARLHTERQPKGSLRRT